MTGGAVGEREELRAARFVLDYWLTAYRGFLKTDTTFGIGTHPLNLVQAAMDGETDPAELGLPPDLHDAFRRHLSVNEGGVALPVAAEHLLVKEVGHDEQAGTSSGADKSSDGAVGGRSSVSELRSEGGAGHGSGQPDDVLPLGEDRQVRLRPSVGGGVAPVEPQEPR